MRLLRLLWTYSLVASAQGASLKPRAATCDKVTLPEFEDFKVLSTKGTVVQNYQSTPGFSFCNLTVAVTHGDGDVVYVWVWLPLSNWNQRVMATGGGGLYTGYESNMPGPTLQGYASAWTEGGLTRNLTIDAGSALWTIKAPGVPDTPLLKNYATRAAHAMAVVLKASAHAFYGVRPRYAYYSGCSTGGRMGYMTAENYPEDFDGILAHAPGVNMPRISTFLSWPSIVMENLVAPPNCVFEAYQAELVRQCDPQDGAVDGLVSDPLSCKYDLQKLVGTKISNCVNTTGPTEVTAGHANVIAKILEGPRAAQGDFLWYGLAPGTPFSTLANTLTTNGNTVAVPWALAMPWIVYFVTRNPSLNTTMTFKEYEEVYMRSMGLMDPLLGAEYPDLSAFRRRGGKLLTYHGLADTVVPHNGTIRYREALKARMRISEDKINKFYKLYLAPGVGHCSGGIGPNPLDPLTPLVKWVENNVEPATLFANTTTTAGVTVTRNLCPHPQRLKYRGTGDVNKAESFTCA
ncbi:feruloyl esterase [Thozetella sp. PMI_491]|nr:feruloyl esterase [Thozetella sp. PMI_491]